MITLTFDKSAIFDNVRMKTNCFLGVALGNEKSEAEITEEDKDIFQILFDDAVDGMMGALSHLDEMCKIVNLEDYLTLHIGKLNSKNQKGRLALSIEKFLVTHIAFHWLTEKGISATHLNLEGSYSDLRHISLMKDSYKKRYSL